MKRKRYTEEQIIGFLKAHEAGAKTSAARKNFESGSNCHLGLRQVRIGE